MSTEGAFDPRKVEDCDLEQLPKIPELPDIELCGEEEIPIVDPPPVVFPPTDLEEPCDPINGSNPQPLFPIPDVDDEPCAPINGQTPQPSFSVPETEDGCDGLFGQTPQSVFPEVSPDVEPCDPVNGFSPQSVFPEVSPDVEPCDPVNGFSPFPPFIVDPDALVKDPCDPPREGPASPSSSNKPSRSLDRPPQEPQDGFNGPPGFSNPDSGDDPPTPVERIIEVVEHIVCMQDRLAKPNPFGTDTEGKPFKVGVSPFNWNSYIPLDEDTEYSETDVTTEDIEFPSTLDAALSMGTIKISTSTYEPIRAVYYGGEEKKDENGETIMIDNPEFLPDGTSNPDYDPTKPSSYPDTYKRGDYKYDENDQPLYLLAREVNTIQGNYARSRRDHRRNKYQFKYEDEIIQNDYGWFPFLLNGMIPYQFNDDGTINEWPTTTDIEKAQYNYDPAICYFLDWNEVLVEGERVECTENTVTVTIPQIDDEGKIIKDGDEIQYEDIEFKYYEVVPPGKYITKLQGSASVKLASCRITRDKPYPSDTPGPNDYWNLTFLDDLSHSVTDRCERIFLELQGNHAKAKLINAVGICNDCSQERLRGVFYKTDIKDKKYPITCEVDYLPFGYAIETARITCYYHTNVDDCNPIWTRPLYTILRENEWHLRLQPSDCSVSCTNLTPTQGIDPPEV